ncbi:PREDICTED: serine/threonine-protein kinase GL21140 [Nicrophorus vespilloides]|uniref:non-specific serine/threonine protein kinase n=1 Tax=Nicrophorus vespilloides TaxID=110193 RepID=A0ABM1MC06_NICVS|nr:PREDICTED: serine/threonine-protein kinase GL21140 [Nicrophorus vespilloides]
MMSKNNVNGSRSLSSASCNSITSDEIIDSIADDLTPTRGRLSSAALRTQKAKRIRFFHNGNKFFYGVVIPVTPERYRTFDSLKVELTSILIKSVNLPSGVRTIFTIDGKKISNVDELEDGKEYVCGGKGDTFKKIEYNKTDLNKSRRLSSLKLPTTPSLPRIISPEYVRPRLVTIIRNGPNKPRKIIRLLLNKRNSSSMEQVLRALTEAAQLDSGAVRKVFTLSGSTVTSLTQFFDIEDVFFVYGNERYSITDFELEFEESKSIQSYKKVPGLKNGVGPKPKMPKKKWNRTFESEGNLLAKLSQDENINLPSQLKGKYSVGKMIGDGNFAVVRLCKDKVTGVEYALKIIDKSKCKGKEDMIDNEVSILRKVDHPNIIRFVEQQDTPSMLFLVAELSKGGDLFDAITVSQKFSEEQASLMITHLASALSYLHNLNIVHRDVKPENLFVDFDGDRIRILKLGDFGLACKVDELLFTVCGTPTYVAPEILAETGYGLKIDVWAAGVIMYILLCGYPPFVNQDNDQEKLFDCILSGQYDFPDEYWGDVSNTAKELIQNMLQLAPELRFSAEDVLDHPWLQSFS